MYDRMKHPIYIILCMIRSCMVFDLERIVHERNATCFHEKQNQYSKASARPAGNLVLCD